MRQVVGKLGSDGRYLSNSQLVLFLKEKHPKMVKT